MRRRTCLENGNDTDLANIYSQAGTCKCAAPLSYFWQNLHCGMQRVESILRNVADNLFLLQIAKSVVIPTYGRSCRSIEDKALQSIIKDNQNMDAC